MHGWWRPRLSRVTTPVRQGGRAAMLWSGRITIAAVASYVVATLLFPGTRPLLAPLTAMLVVQVTPVSLLASGVDRVVAVVAGVALAVTFASVAPLEWWSLGLLIFASITIGQALRLRANLVEVAISGMLVLGVGAYSAGSAAWQRIAETLVGAAVGILANLLFPPKVATGDAGEAIDGLADKVSDLLTRAAAELRALPDEGGDLGSAARAWLGEARLITHDIPRVGAALLHAEQGRRFNVRAVGTADVAPGLRQGLESLEHSAIAIRGMMRALADATADPAWSDETSGDLLDELAQSFEEMAGGVDAFGQLVRDEADPQRRLTATEVEEVRRALQGLQEARARHEGALTLRSEPHLVELQAVVLSTVKRLVRELDLDERVRRQVRPARAPGPLVRPAGEEQPDQEAETQVLPRLTDPRRDRRRS